MWERITEGRSKWANKNPLATEGVGEWMNDGVTTHNRNAKRMEPTKCDYDNYSLKARAIPNSIKNRCRWWWWWPCAACLLSAQTNFLHWIKPQPADDDFHVVMLGRQMWFFLSSGSLVDLELSTRSETDKRYLFSIGNWLPSASCADLWGSPRI